MHINDQSAGRNKSMKGLRFALAMSLLSPQVLWAATLKSLDASSLQGGKVELKLHFDQPVATPKGYSIDQPARIAIDLPGVTSGLKSRHQDLGLGNARSVTVVETKDRARLIVNLNKSAGYQTRVVGNDLYVTVGDSIAARPVVAQASPTEKQVFPAAGAPAYGPPVAVRRGVRNVDFQRGEQGEGNVVIDLSGINVAPEIDEKGQVISLRFPGAQVPDALRLQYDVKDFATPVRSVNVSQQGADARVDIKADGQWDYLAYQTDDRLTISVKPLSQQEQDRRKADNPVYTGEKLSLNLENIDVTDALYALADFTDKNMVISDSVKGRSGQGNNITLRLKDTPWDQALDLVLRAKGLDKREEGNVLLIGPADEIAARERQQLESKKQIEALAPLRRELVQISYAKAADIKALFEQVNSEGGDSGGKSKDAGRGSIAVDERTNSLIVNKPENEIEELRRIVSQLDIPVRQVMIEARVVEANVNFEKQLGVRWGGYIGKGSTIGYGGTMHPQGYGGNVSASDWNKSGYKSWGRGLPTTDGSSRQGWDVQDGTIPVPFVDLGVSNPTSGVGIGYLGNNVVLDLQLTAMEATGNGEIVSQPKVFTSDKKTAKILRGAEIPYQEASSSGSTSTSFKEAALSLEVTPQITPDNRIIMDVAVTRDRPDYTQAVGAGREPPIDKNAVNASVMVNDGETMVLGGVFENVQQKNVEKVPFLGDLPYLGRLFRYDHVQDNKTELLIFLTPRIVDGQTVSSNP